MSISVLKITHNVAITAIPPTDKEYNVRRAFEAGWGGVVWKTLGLDPNIVNVNGPRYGAVWGPDRRLLGMNNIELITDRIKFTNNPFNKDETIITRYRNL